MSASTSENHHVEAIIDLLQQATAWTTTLDPEIRPYWEDAQSEKGPGADQPPVAYVWSPVDSSLDRFSMDTEYRVTNTVEIQFWSLDESEPVVLLNDAISILSQYLDDNKIRTPYTDVQPTAASDYREQKQARVTDHYLTSLEVDTDGLQNEYDSTTAFDFRFTAGFV